MDVEVEEEIKPLMGKSPVALFSSWVKAGRSLDVQDEDGRTALHNYTDSEDVETVKFLLENKASSNIRDNRRGTTAVHIAARKRRTDLLLLFVENCVDLDLKNKLGWTPLHCASRVGCVENVRILLDHGAAVELKTKHHRPPFRFARSCPQVDVLREFVRKGIDLDAQDYGGFTLLHQACRDNQFNTTEYLLQNGADVRKRCWCTSLHLAAMGSGIDSLNLLLSFGADIDARDIFGRSALFLAVGRSTFENAKFLIDRGAFIDVRSGQASYIRPKSTFGSSSGDTPLHTAVLGLCLKSVVYLLEKGALVGFRNSNGQTAYDNLWQETELRVKIETLKGFGKYILKYKLLQPVDENVDNETALAEEEISSCQAEVERIKSTEVSEGFSLYEVVTQRDRPDYLFNAELKTQLEAFLESPDFLDQFPNYGMILRSQLVRSKRSQYFLSRKALTHIFSESHKNCLKKLPQLVWTIIFSLMCDHDLYNLTKCVGGD